MTRIYVDEKRVGSTETMVQAVQVWDVFQRIGIPVHQGGTLPLDDPNQHMPWEPWAENE